jgi:3-hydroxyacyl-[acyl-carrier-protein] dehydratase
MTRSQIEAAIPHRPPFLLLDEIVELDKEHIVCRQTFSPDEPFYQGHYPGFPLTPGVLLCEAAMQAGAVLASQHIPPGATGVPVATRMNDVRFKRIVRPGETVTIEVRLVERLADAFFFEAKLRVQDKLAVRFEFACALAKIDDASQGG